MANVFSVTRGLEHGESVFRYADLSTDPAGVADVIWLTVDISPVKKRRLFANVY